MSGDSASNFRIAGAGDIPQILPMMRDFYSFERLEFNEERSRRLLSTIFADERLGRVVLLHCGEELAGYMVLGFGFSLEFHGRTALLDELYVIPAYRGRGIGGAAAEHAAAICRDLGIRCLQLEADYFNDRAHEFYLRRGFRDHQRHLMTRWL
jgi:GNAT superfamily N-acetyltransferase